MIELLRWLRTHGLFCQRKWLVHYKASDGGYGSVYYWRSRITQEDLEAISRYLAKPHGVQDICIVSVIKLSGRRWGLEEKP